MLEAFFTHIYETNSFVKLLGMKFVSIEPGKAVLSMPIKEDIHTNIHKTVHGGAFAALIDTAMGSACFSMRRKVVTTDLSLSFIRNVPSGEEVIAKASVIHAGRSTMVVDGELYDERGKLVMKGKGTFCVLGDVEWLPAEE